MSLEIDKEWMTEVDTISSRYLEGVASFLAFVVKYGGGFDKYLCPCSLCQNANGMVDLPTITYDLVKNGIDQSYIFWKYHGERDLVKDIDKSTAKSNGQNDDQNNHPMMDYDSYDACINDCILYRKEHANKVVCPTCNAPRYKITLTPGKSGTSKTKLKTTRALREKLVACRAEKNELKTDLNESRQQINNLSSRFSRFESFMDEMRGRLPTEVVSHSPSQEISTGTTHTDFEHHTNVAIMNMAHEVVAYGTLLKDGTSGILHGRHIKDFEVKVLLDKIILQDERLYLGTQGFAETYSEVGIGGFVVHHREFLKRT